MRRLAPEPRHEPGADGSFETGRELRDSIIWEVVWMSHAYTVGFASDQIHDHVMTRHRYTGGG